MDIFTPIVDWLSGIGDKTAFAAVILAFISASLGALGYFAKLLDTSIKARRKDGKLYRSAVIRFYSDIIIWQKDFVTTYTNEKFDEMALEIANGGRDFKFSVPSSDQSDFEEIMKFIHRMETTEARIIRAFMVYGGVLNSVQRILGTELATFEPERKMRALASFKEMSKFVLLLTEEALVVLKGNRFLQVSDERFNTLFDRRDAIKAESQLFLAEKLALLAPPEGG